MNNLNKQQQEATNTIDGAVMVVAGPGTGKTQILASRIANMLQSEDHQINPVNILCLTYTDAGVVAMRQRLIEIIGTVAYKVNIHTFHSFCNNVVQWNLDYFGVRELEVITDLEVTQVLYDLIDEMAQDNPLKRFKGDIYYESTRLRTLFQFMKEENLTSSQIKSQVKEYVISLKNREEYIYKRANSKKNIQVGDVKEALILAEKEKMDKLMAGADLFEAYNHKLMTRKRYDYSDMIGWVLNAFRDSDDFLLNFQEKYQYVLVDEFQDTNGSQSALIDLLMGFWEDPNIFVVGDYKQAIYEFNGARIQNIRDFQIKYKPKIIELTQNYRSIQQILDLSKSVIDNNAVTLEGASNELVSNKKSSLDVAPYLMKYGTVMEEEMCVVRDISEIIEGGVQPSDIAVIYRKHRQSENIIDELSTMGIPVSVKRRLNVLHDVRVRQIITILMYIHSEAQMPHRGEPFLFEILHYDFWDNDRKTIEQTATMIYEYRKDNYKWRTCLADMECIKILEELIGDYHNDTVAMVIEKILNKTGLVEQLLESDTKEQDMLVVNSFFSWIKSEIFKNPALITADLIDLIDKMIANDYSIPVVEVNFGDEGGVNFMTCHGAKGLEFEYVFMIGCTMNEWEKSRGNVNKFKLPDTITHSLGDDALESNRRLFYVAMTRAKKWLIVSYAEKNDAGKELERTQFIDEAGEHAFMQPSITLPDLSHHLHTRLSQAIFQPQLDKHIIDRALVDYRLSVSHLNKYLDCPVAFYYENILRVPFIASEALIFGNAIHHAMKELYVEAKKNQHVPDIKFLIVKFEEDVLKNKGQMTAEAMKRRILLGQRILPRYYIDHIIGSNMVTLNEYKINNAVIGDVPVKGDIDKIEFNGETAGIVDYKTGNVKYAKKAMKPPSDSNPLGGNYWRQGVFYEMMLSEQPTNDWFTGPVRFEMIDEEFMGPMALSIGSGDRLFVVNQIKETYNSIINHEFTEGCGEESCKWCEFQKQVN